MYKDEDTIEKETVCTVEDKECVCSWALIKYYNVEFLLALIDDFDKERFSYLASRIVAKEQLFMRDIYSWCFYHNIKVVTRFRWKSRFPITANLWNYYSYQRARWEYKKLFWQRINT